MTLTQFLFLSQKIKLAQRKIFALSTHFSFPSDAAASRARAGLCDGRRLLRETALRCAPPGGLKCVATGLGPGCTLLLQLLIMVRVGSDTSALRSLKGLECVAVGLGSGCTVPLLLLI